MPVAEIVGQDDMPTDDANAIEKNTNQSDGNDENEDEDDDDATTHTAKCGSIPTCDWEGEKCYFLGI